mmetsp:Transcript_13245/g.40009  ORF Transcript_13245/g.40009 Transcript_13245/m.40009 type:complete len:916 (+) Transcript_13245:94-2841(+)
MMQLPLPVRASHLVIQYPSDDEKKDSKQDHIPQRYAALYYGQQTQANIYSLQVDYISLLQERLKVLAENAVHPLLQRPHGMMFQSDPDQLVVLSGLQPSILPLETRIHTLHWKRRGKLALDLFTIATYLQDSSIPMTSLSPSDLHLCGSSLWLPFDFGFISAKRWIADENPNHSFVYILGRVLCYLFSGAPEKNATLSDDECLEELGGGGEKLPAGLLSLIKRCLRSPVAQGESTEGSLTLPELGESLRQVVQILPKYVSHLQENSSDRHGENSALDISLLISADEKLHYRTFKPRRGKSRVPAFCGSDLCDWLLVQGFSSNRAEAVVFCNLLLFQKFLVNLSHNVAEGKFTDDEEGLYRVDERYTLEAQNKQAASSEDLSGSITSRRNLSGSAFGGLKAAAARAKMNAGQQTARRRQQRQKAKSIATKPSLYFGKTLEEITVRDHSADSLPRIVPLLCKSVLERRGFEAEGIFRLSANNDELMVIRAALDVGDFHMLEEGSESKSPHMPAALLKRFFRDLSEPPIPIAFYERALACETVEQVTELMRDLSPVARLVIEYLVAFVQLIGHPSFQPMTRMTLENLAVVFAPSLIRSGKDDPLQAMQNSTKERKFVELLFSIEVPPVAAFRRYDPNRDPAEIALEEKRRLAMEAAMSMWASSGSKQDDEENEENEENEEKPTAPSRPRSLSGGATSGGTVNKESSGSSLQRPKKLVRNLSSGRNVGVKSTRKKTGSRLKRSGAASSPALAGRSGITKDLSLYDEDANEQDSLKSDKEKKRSEKEKKSSSSSSNSSSSSSSKEKKYEKEKEKEKKISRQDSSGQGHDEQDDPKTRSASSSKLSKKNSHQSKVKILDVPETIPETILETNANDEGPTNRRKHQKSSSSGGIKKRRSRNSNKSKDHKEANLSSDDEQTER